MLRYIVLLCVIFNIFGVLWIAAQQQLPPDFVHLVDVDPTIVQDIRYVTHHNFIGWPIYGYLKGTCILTQQAANALSQVQKDLLPQNLSLKVYDCYRPQMSVDYFVLWGFNMSDDSMRELWPDYIAYKSGHSRGSTMDLTIVPVPTPPEEKYKPGMPLKSCLLPVGQRFGDNSIDMGTGFDCCNPKANTNTTGLTPIQVKNRQLLVNAMAKRGFTNYPMEWWHYTLNNEPFPDTYFNFYVE